MSSKVYYCVLMPTYGSEKSTNTEKYLSLKNCLTWEILTQLTPFVMYKTNKFYNNNKKT